MPAEGTDQRGDKGHGQGRRRQPTNRLGIHIRRVRTRRSAYHRRRPDETAHLENEVCKNQGKLDVDKCQQKIRQRCLASRCDRHDNHDGEDDHGRTRYKGEYRGENQGIDIGVNLFESRQPICGSAHKF